MVQNILQAWFRPYCKHGSDHTASMVQTILQAWFRPYCKHGSDHTASMVQTILQAWFRPYCKHGSIQCRLEAYYIITINDDFLLSYFLCNYPIAKYFWLYWKQLI